MPFRRNQTIKNCCWHTNAVSLSGKHRKNPSPATAELSDSYGRVALCASAGFKGSLTLEAAMVLPIFLFLILSLVFLIQVFMVHIEVQGGIFQAAREIASNATVLGSTQGEGAVFGGASADLFCKATAKSKTLECIGDHLDNQICLKGGKEGLQFYASNISDDMVSVIATYRVQLPYAFGMDISFPVVQRCCMRIWNGKASSDSQGEEMVYITKTGSVYHKRSDCSHIKLDIKAVSISDISAARNDNGAKYYSCEKCGGVAGAVVYITGDGTKYHSTLTCSGLKRSVTRIGISKVGGRSPCSRCGR